MENGRLPASAGWSWVREGMQRLRRAPIRWLGMGLVFLLIALVLLRIPLLGGFVLVLLAPIMLAGALLAARDNAPAPAPRGAAGWLRAFTLTALGELFQVFRREEHAFAIVIVCILTLGLVVLVNIPELLLTGGSVLSGLAGAGLGGVPRPGMIAGLVVVSALYLALLLGLLYLVPLTLFGQRQPVPAVAESLRTCAAQPAALAAFLGSFAVLALLIAIGFELARALGYLLVLALGPPALAAFALGLHASYRALFERHSTTVTPGQAPPAAA